MERMGSFGDLTGPPGTEGRWPPVAALAGTVTPGVGRVEIDEGPDAHSARADDGTTLWFTGTVTSLGTSDPAIQAKKLLGGFMQSGIDYFSSLSGFAVFAVWDPPARTFHLVRHPGGVPALFYRSEAPGTVTFSTRLVDLIESGDRVDWVTATQFLRIGTILAPRTMVEEIRRLPPTEAMTVTPNDSTVRPIWVPDWGKRDAHKSTAEAVDELDTLVNEKVTAWLEVSGERPAILMSGGIDSAGLAAAMVRLGQHDLVAYTYSFNDQDGFTDEFDEAARVAVELGIEHRPIAYPPSFIEDNLDWMVAWFGEPFALAVHTAQLNEVVENGHEWLYGGTGPDAFYPYASQDRWHRLVDLIPDGAHDLVSRSLAKVSFLPGAKGASKAFRLSATSDAEIATQYVGPGLDHPGLKALGVDEGNILRSDTESASFMAARLERIEAEDTVSRWSYGRISINYPDHGSGWMERWMRAYGLRPGLPLAEPDFGKVLMRRANLMTEKGEFRELATRSLPRDLAYNRKVGQSLPLGNWWNGPLAALAKERIGDASDALDGYLDGAAALQVLDEHQSGASNHQWLIWKLITLVTWKRQFDSIRASRDIG